MKASFSNPELCRQNWYRGVLFSILTLLAGIYSINVNGQTKPTPAAAARSVDISGKPGNFSGSHISERDILKTSITEGADMKRDDQAVIGLPEIQQKSAKYVQDQQATAMGGATLSGFEIEEMKTEIKAYQEETPQFLPHNLNASNIPDRNNSNVLRADGPEFKLDDQEINMLLEMQEMEPSISQDEIKSTLKGIPLIISGSEVRISGTDTYLDDGLEVIETEDMQKKTGDDGNVTLKSSLAGENLTPYQPSEWDNKLVVSSATGTHTSNAPFFNNQTLYVDWAVTNNGTAAVTATFYTRLYIDGTLKSTWYTPGLAVGAMASVSDHNIGTLTAGSHSIRIQTDATGVIAETNESDNEFTRYITVYPYVNLTTYQPSGWDSRIVLSTVNGTNTSDPQIFSTDNIYLDWSVANVSSNATTTTFYIDLYIDGVWKSAWTRAGLNANTFTTQLDYLVGKLPAGSHTFLIRIDRDGYVPEYNESDNEYSRTITVVNKNLLPYQPSGWDSRLVVSTVTGTHTTPAAVYNNQDIYVDWCVENNGSAAVTETFHSRLYVDGVDKGYWYTNGLASGSWAYVQDHNIGKLAIGNHTFQIVNDCNGEVTESNEADNSYSRTIYVGPSYNLTPYKPGDYDDKLVLSTVTGTQTSASVFYDTDNIYVDWACLNNGLNDFTTTFYVRLYIDGVSKAAWTYGGLAHNTYTWYKDQNVGKLSAGIHTFRLVVDSDSDVAESDETDNEYTRTITVVNKNLLPYQPVGWDNKIVLSTVTGTNTSASSICDTQPLYLDYAIWNNGSAPITETFYVRLYVDGVAKATWTRAGVGANTYYAIQDYSLGTLTAGAHTIKITADVLNNVDETSETDNEYTLTFNVSTCKNITTYQPSTWDNKLVLSTVTGTHTSATTIYNNEDILLDWAVINNGTVNITESFTVKLYIDGVQKSSWSASGLNAGVYLYHSDFNAGKLAAGDHTFKIVADADNNVAETSESDNEYSRTVTIVPAPYLNVSSATLSVGYPEGSAGTFNITSNVNWTASASATWLTLSRTSGSGDATITVTAQKNPTTASRAATVTVSGPGVANKTVTVTQEAAPASLDVSPATIPVGYQEGSTGTFNITSNISWTASGSATWITLSKTSGSGDATITVTAQKNPNTAARTATITLSGSGVANKTVTVTQEAASAYLDISPATVPVGYQEGSTGTFNITSNISWTASGSASWITLSKTSGSGDATITVTAQKNPAASSRTATITLSGTGVANKTVTVTQEAAPAYLDLSPATVSVGYQEGSTGTFNITSNISWTATGSPSWITLSRASGSGDATITVTAQKNPTTAARTATITISGTGVANKTVTVNQEAAPPSMDVSPSTMPVGYQEGSTGIFNITSNISWTATGSASWITLSSTNGSGDATITVTAQKNPTAASRTATITLSGSGVANKTVTVTQEAAPASLEVSIITLSVGYQEGSAGTFNITSNINWTASGSAAWITLSRTSGSGDATITITAQKNTGTEPRIATITVSGTGVADKTVTVTQEGAPPSLDVSPATLPLTYQEGSTGNLTIASNISWTASGSAAWVTLSRTSGSGDAAITITAQKNPATTPRTATITVSGTGVADKTVTVTQEAAPASLEVSSATLSVGYQEGTTVTFNITSNTSWTASASAPWITLSNTSGSGDLTITITVQKNPTTAARTATITLSGTGFANKTVTFTQEGAPTGFDEPGSSEIKLYPNPANTILFIEGIPANTTIFVYDMNGKLCLTGILHENWIDISDLFSGAYIIIFEDNDHRITNRIVKR